ncbi:hypothetical protein JCM24511_02719 [Saitozyma sp. JCM 24511]|nr:hypothetical protein JCM24511_02719 [Saitozyma sp. JCM 24511]
MRGEHCVAGASILSGIAIILLVFVNISQINPGSVTSGLYFAEINVEAYGAAFVGATGTTPSMYDTSTTDLMGTGKGLRQYYRWGLYNSCGYQKAGSGICNATVFGYPMDGFANILADVPASYKTTTTDLITSDSFIDANYNHGMSRAGSLLIFVASLASLAALITGAVKARIFFFLATIFSSISAFLLLLGATLWTALIAKDAAVNSLIVASKYNAGMDVTAGPALYLTWVSFALMTLSVFPYVVSCCTYRK